MSNHQIFCLPLSKVSLIGQFLDFLTDPVNAAGKKAEGYWIINAEARLNELDDSTKYFNAFMHQCKARGYNSVMFLNQ